MKDYLNNIKATLKATLPEAVHERSFTNDFCFCPMGVSTSFCRKTRGAVDIHAVAISHCKMVLLMPFPPLAACKSAKLQVLQEMSDLEGWVYTRFATWT